MKNIGYITIALLIASCGGNSFKTENGTKVTYIKKGEGTVSQDSTEISYFNL